MKNAVLLLSSGLDSSANIALLPDMGITPKVALTIDYGQKTAVEEITHAANLCEYFQIKHQIFSLHDFQKLTGSASALMGDETLMPNPPNLDDIQITTESAKAVWVPNRNAVFISLAAALAEYQSYQYVGVGFNFEEAATFPDNSAKFMQAMTNSLAYSTSNHVEVVSATVQLNKKEIVEKLVPKNFPFELIWSCYVAARKNSKHCGECESCQRLKRALRLGMAKIDFERIENEIF